MRCALVIFLEIKRIINYVLRGVKIGFKFFGGVSDDDS